MALVLASGSGLSLSPTRCRGRRKEIQVLRQVWPDHGRRPLRQRSRREGHPSRDQPGRLRARRDRPTPEPATASRLRISRPPYYHLAGTPDEKRSLFSVWGNPKLGLSIPRRFWPRIKEAKSVERFSLIPQRVEEGPLDFFRLALKAWAAPLEVLSSFPIRVRDHRSTFARLAKQKHDARRTKPPLSWPWGRLEFKGYEKDYS